MQFKGKKLVSRLRYLATVSRLILLLPPFLSWLLKEVVRSEKLLLDPEDGLGLI